MPARPRAARTTAVEAGKFPTFDELAEDARKDAPEDPYLLPLRDDVIEITMDGDRFLSLTTARMNGDYEEMYNLMFPDKGDRAVVRAAFKNSPPLMVDRLVGNVLSYFYGNGLIIEAGKGNSPAS